MRRVICFRVSAAMALAALVLPPEVCAQSLPGGLFGSTRSDTVNRDRLEATASVSEGWDTEVPPLVANDFPQGPLQSGGLSTTLIGMAEYAHTRRRTRISANGASALRYYNRLNRTDVLGHSGALGLDVRLADSANLIVGQTAAYSPSYLFQLFPTIEQPELGEIIPIAPDYRLLLTESYMYRSDVEVAAGSRRRARFTAAGSYERTSFGSPPAGGVRRPQLEIYGGRAGVERAIHRNGRLFGEYEYRTGDFSVAKSTEHRVAFGFEYSRALSTSRRASFRGQIAPSTLTVPEPVLIPASSNSSVTERLFRLQGEATVEYHVHLHWLVAGTYSRGVEYMAILGAPVLSDATRLSVEGLLTRRVDLLVTAAAINGASAIDLLSHLDSATANVRLRYAFTRMFALYGEYVYYNYDFGERQTLAPNLPRVFDQHGIRVGIMLWKPVF